jgi:hypothetical protein
MNESHFYVSDIEYEEVLEIGHKPITLYRTEYTIILERPDGSKLILEAEDLKLVLKAKIRV